MKKIILGVVAYYLMHIALVCMFPSHSEDAVDYQRTQEEAQQDRDIMEAFLAAQEN